MRRYTRTRMHVCAYMYAHKWAQVGIRGYLWPMLNSPTAAHSAAIYLATVLLTEKAQSERSGCSIAVLRLVLTVTALRTTGASVTAANIVGAGLGEAAGVRTVLKQAISGGYLVKPLGRGAVVLTEAGRILISEMARAWERAARAVRAFSPVVPYGAVQRAKDAKRAKKAKKADSRRKS